MKRFVILIAITCTFTWATRPALATRLMQHYDTDSLCGMAELVVAVEVGKAIPCHTAIGDCTNFEVKVRSTFKGKAAAGSILRVAGLDKIYRAPGMAGVADSWSEITTGDVVYLFLVPPKAYVGGGLSVYEYTDAQYKVIESGVRLSIGGNVYSFGQDLYMPELDGPDACQIPGGPYSCLVAMTGKTFPHATVESVADFEKHLASSVRFSDDLQHELKTKTLQPNERKKILDGRSATLKRELAWNDYIAESLGVSPPWLDATTQP